jgi:iron(III) transport system substrate-binding protein
VQIILGRDTYTTAHDSVIPAAYKEPGHHWTGFTVLPMVILYNTALVKGTEIPVGWGDLLRPSYKGTIAFADPIKSGSSYTIAVTLLTVFGRDDGNGWKFLKEFIANLDGKILSGSTAVPKGVADGEYRIGLTLEESALRYALSGAPVALVYPAEGTTAVADGSAIVRGCRHVEYAERFLDFIVGKEVQSLVISQMNRRCVRTDLSAPAGLKKIEEMKLVEYDPQWVAKNRQRIIEKWKLSVLTNSK